MGSFRDYCPFGKCQCNIAKEIINWKSKRIKIPDSCQSCDYFFRSFNLEYLHEFFKKHGFICDTKGFGLDLKQGGEKLDIVKTV